ncbi:MAG: hypothetical protein GY940_24865 [bacterium]|nr:hypothetical protein [bacterium]
MKRYLKINIIILMIGLVCLPAFSQPGNIENQTGTGESDSGGLGVFVNINTNSIQFIDPVTQTVSGHYLKGKIGSYEGGLLDVAITPDGKKAIVSNFDDGLLFSIDISGGFGVEPTLLGSEFVHMPPEDIAITPDGKYALTTDGDYGYGVSVVEISNMRFVMHRFLPCFCLGTESVSVAADGQTVIVTDFWAGAVHTLLLNEEGKLRYQNTYWIIPFWPVNSSVSPDGKTVIISVAFRGVAPVFTVTAPGQLNYKGTTKIPASAGQSCVFSKDGSKAYYLTNDPTKRGTMIHELAINGPGQVEATGNSMNVFPTRGFGGLFGVDTIALDPSGKYLYLTNPTDDTGIATVEVIDLETFTQVKYLPAKGIPIGIEFTGYTPVGNGGSGNK